MAAPDGTLFAAWDELIAGTGRRVKLARGRPDRSGMTTFQTATFGDDAGSYPAVAAAPNHLILAWTARQGSESMIAVRRIPY